MNRSGALQKDHPDRILDSRKALTTGASNTLQGKVAEEGGCGVVGFAASVPVQGRYIYEPSIRMHNRGNGKGGGIACACLNHAQQGVDQSILRDDYILQIAVLNPDVAPAIENEFVTPHFRVDYKVQVEPVIDWRELGLPIKPPDIVRYFVRTQKDALQQFVEKNDLSSFPERYVEDEFVYQNSFRLNRKYYASLGEKQAFVLSHARNLMIFKIVGYAEQVVQYYGLDDLEANIWIAHQRFPTRGRVWHPAGSHPFNGMNEALVHNGDFANYHSVSEYLRQHNIISQFLTDTEVAVLLFDLLHRFYQYPLEYIIEAIAPTAELDFDMLPEEKQRVYRLIQRMHVHSSPDGPWFFIIAQSSPDKNMYNLLGITDTSMLRPQVFALQEGEVSIGLVASEKQAIDATLESLSRDNSRFRPIADRYWNARGGSYTDGGAFSFTLTGQDGVYSLSCTDKFGNAVISPGGDHDTGTNIKTGTSAGPEEIIKQVHHDISASDSESAFSRIVAELPYLNMERFSQIVHEVKTSAIKSDALKESAIVLLTLLNNRRYESAGLKRSVLLQVVRQGIEDVLNSVPPVSSNSLCRFKRIDWHTRKDIRPPAGDEQVLAINGRDFPPEGIDSGAQLTVTAYSLGWKRFIVYGLRGQRFLGCGFGPDTKGVRFDIYGSSGDYLGSGIDGMEIYVHDNGQDQLGQIMKSGRLVVYGDVGQAFMYGAKGGEVYIMGNCAGRPLINAVGRPRVIINGTCLDYLAESFMAGDPYKDGGFIVLNGIEFDESGKVREQASPYPGSNLFSMASGGAIFVRDPHKSITGEQLNGGEFTDFTDRDWDLILPYLQKNEELFGISINNLLTVEGKQRLPHEVYRKVHAVKLSVLTSVSIE
jgi:glutamate synthase domain-containing protein 1/glutamate synthase domain-containing protein 3